MIRRRSSAYNRGCHVLQNQQPRSTSCLFSIPPPRSIYDSSSTATTKSSATQYNGFLSRLNSTPPRKIYEGAPSTPGWRNPNQLDKLTDWAVNEDANRPVLCEYQPDGSWLWSRWKGTVLSMTYKPILFNIFIGICVDIAIHKLSGNSWPILATPPGDDPIIQQLQGLNSLWEYQVTLCTFVLTFFTAEAYKHWRMVYFTTRAIQGRINDVVMLVTVSAAQDQPDSIDLVTKLCRWIRLSHTFFWAATPTCSNGVSDGGQDVNPAEMVGEAAIGPLLLSADGLRGLVEVGELTTEECDALLTSGLPPSQYTYILLEWVGIGFLQGLEAGLLGHRDEQSKDQAKNAGLEENFLRQMTQVRAEYFSIGDYQAGRMPLAYVQLVQILVDSLVFLAPFSLYSDLGTLSIILTGLLTLFFKGLLELSKSFLDPFGNEGYPGQNIRVDVLVSELNFGAASRWTLASQAYPLPPKAIVNNGGSASGSNYENSTASSFEEKHINGSSRFQ